VSFGQGLRFAIFEIMTYLKGHWDVVFECT